MRWGRAWVVGAAVVLPAVLLAAGLVGTADAAIAPDPAAPAATGAAMPDLPAVTGQRPAPPEDDPFYTEPADSDGADPGDLLRYRKSHAYLKTDQAGASPVPAPVRAWQVIYRSTTAEGDLDTVSGTVLVPLTPWAGPGPRPIVGYGPGAHGIADRCAPSYSLATGAEGEVTRMLEALSHGWALAITDYEGLGTPGDHTYLVGLSEARATLDITRAAMKLPGAGLSEHAPVGLWGYSQGGGAIGVAAEQAREYAPELHFVGAAEGGVPADIEAVGRYVDGGPVFGALAATAAGFDTAYPDLDLSDLFNAKGRELLDQIRTECSDDMGRLQANHKLSEYTKSADALSYPPLDRVLRENGVGGRTPSMPIYLYHAQFDELVPLDVAHQLFQNYCRRGVRITYTVVPLTEHILAADGGAPAAVSWLASRFAGVPAPSNCVLSGLPIVG